MIESGGAHAPEAASIRPHSLEMTTPLRAVLFDFDGTLGYYRPSHLELYVTAAAECGVHADLQSLRSAVDTGWSPWETPDGVDHSAHSADEQAFGAIRAQLHLERYAAAGVIGTADALRAAAVRLVEIEAAPEHFGLFEDTIAALERVRAAGMRAYIVSNHIWQLPEVVEALGLGGLVEEVLTSARVGYRKPHPAIFRAAAAVAREEAAALLYVGDHMANDVEGARAAGMHAVLIDRSGAARAASAETLVIHTLLDVPL